MTNVIQFTIFMLVGIMFGILIVHPMVLGFSQEDSLSKMSCKDLKLKLSNSSSYVPQYQTSLLSAYIGRCT